MLRVQADTTDFGSNMDRQHTFGERSIEGGHDASQNRDLACRAVLLW